jgi:hypothetical protein
MKSSLCHSASTSSWRWLTVTTTSLASPPGAITESVEKVGGGRSTRPASHAAWLPGHHLASIIDVVVFPRISSVDEEAFGFTHGRGVRV